MSCPQCQGIELMFDDEYAAKELKAYRKKGPDKTTRLLIDALKRAGIEGTTLLDIGGGVGGIQYALLKAGAERATSVDASAGYTAVARQEAQAQGLDERIAHRHGNFVEVALELGPADIVTLDRVICCYHDMPSLVRASVGLSQRLYGVVFPRDVWWVKGPLAVARTFMHLIRHPMRFFAHPTHELEAIVRARGFERQYYHRTLIWQVIVYARG